MSISPPLSLKPVYGHFTYALTDQWDLTIGGRYTDEDREMQKVRTVGPLYPGSMPFFRDVAHLHVGTPALFPKASNSFTNFSGLISLGYHWNDDVMAYAKISEGFQSGGFNSRDATFAHLLKTHL